MFALKPSDWDRVLDLRTIISVSLRCQCIVLPLAELSQDANKIQQVFSDENRATLWRAIPALEELQTACEAKEEDPKYNIYRTAIRDGLAKICKYYNRLDHKPVYILALGMSRLFIPSICPNGQHSFTSIL